METIEIKEKEVKALDSLVKINHDRQIGYGKAIDATQDLDLKLVFEEYVLQSKLFKNELELEILDLGGEVENESTLAGKLHHVWIDVKANFTGKDRHSILQDCAFGDNAAEMTYEAVLKEADLAWSKKITDLLTSQHEKIRNAHQKIKDLLENSK